MSIKSFNLRVYGLLIHDDSVLISEEVRGGFEMLKFPGGGLEKGEGLGDCLRREFHEELNVEIELLNHFYVNDFLQVSAFNDEDQLISFYYLVDCKNIQAIPVDQYLSHDHKQKVKWVKIEELKELDFTFPLDRIVAQQLAESF